jgi:hypothetical protein
MIVRTWVPDDLDANAGDGGSTELSATLAALRSSVLKAV